MIFVCKEVNVYNYQYHYHYDQKGKKVNISKKIQQPLHKKISLCSKKEPIHLLAHKRKNRTNQKEKFYSQNHSNQISYNSVSDRTIKKNYDIQNLGSAYVSNKTTDEPRVFQKNHNSLQNTLEIHSNHERRPYSHRNVEKSPKLEVPKSDRGHLTNLKLGRTIQMHRSFHEFEPELDLKNIENSRIQRSCNSNKKLDRSSRIAEKTQQRLKERLCELKRVTVVSQEIGGEESHMTQNVLIDESTIVQHDIQGKFIPIGSSPISKRSFEQLGGLYCYSEYNAIETSNNLIVSIKEIQTQNSESIQRFHNEIRIYSQIQIHPSIMQLYRVYMNRGNQILVKQPYTSVLQEHAYSSEIIQKKLKNIKKALEYLQAHEIYLDWLSPEDFRQILGTWKLSNLSKTVSENNKVQISTNLLNLKNKLMK